MDYLDPKIEDKELASLSNLALAHVGDGVFELMVRTRLALRGRSNANEMHKKTVRLVAAPAQAKMAERLIPLLTEEEREVFRRGRNAKVGSVPKAASIKEYHEATALEALFGRLWLRGERERLGELFSAAMEED